MADKTILDQAAGLYPRDRSWHPPALTPGYKSSLLRAPRHALLSIDTHRLRALRPALRPFRNRPAR